MAQREVVICDSLCAAKTRITGAFGGVSAPVNQLPLRDNVSGEYAWSVLLCWDFFLFCFLKIIGLFAACLCCWSIIWEAKIWSLIFRVAWHCTYKHKLEEEEVYFSTYCGDGCHSAVSACFTAPALQADRQNYCRALGTRPCFGVFLCFVSERARHSQSCVQKFLLRG